MTVLIFALLAIVIALLVRLELRSHEHSVVEWAAWEVCPGTIRVINEGRHSAHRIWLEAWDDERYTSRHLVRLDPGETWDVDLPHRRPRTDEDPAIEAPAAEAHAVQALAVPHSADRVRRRLGGPGRSHGVARCPYRARALATVETTRIARGCGQVDLRLCWHSRRGIWRTQRIHV